jgi:hypothetical protein
VTAIDVRVARVAEVALARSGFVTSIDVLLGLGWLSAADVENWRRGRVPYLERVTQAGLGKLSTAMRALQRWARQRGLRPSQTDYRSWTRTRTELRFSKSGHPHIEQAYRTHWVGSSLPAHRHRGPARSHDDPAGCLMPTRRHPAHGDPVQPVRTSLDVAAPTAHHDAGRASRA